LLLLCGWSRQWAREVEEAKIKRTENHGLTQQLKGGGSSVDQSSSLQELPVTLPDSFYDNFLKDISAESLAHLINSNRAFKNSLFPPRRGGLVKSPMKESTVRNKLKKSLSPSAKKHFRSFLRQNPEWLEKVAGLWKDKHKTIVKFIGMIDRSSLADRFFAFKELLGPERFLVCLFLLGHCDDKAFAERLDPAFWEREEEKDSLELFQSLSHICKKYRNDRPWLQSSLHPPERVKGKQEKAAKTKSEKELGRKQKQLEKSREKLAKLEAENGKLKEDLKETRTKNEDLRTRVAEWENKLSDRVEQEVANLHREWFSRYKTLEPIKDSGLGKTHTRLDGLLKRAEKALKLQSEADEEYGLISAVSQQLLRIELFLDEVERIYSDSLVVHEEIEGVKKALLAERDRLQSLPGIEKVFKQEFRLRPSEDLIERLRLLDAIPENLGQVLRYEELVKKLIVDEVFEDSDSVRSEIEHKKRQIAAKIYDRFQPQEGRDIKAASFENLDDFVRSGKSEKYDVYVDGYNVLLNIKGAKTLIRDTALTEVRDAFIDAAKTKRRNFRRILLVFDGWSESKDSIENIEIIFSDKDRNSTADSIIIDRIRHRKDKNCVLVTRDNEIIKGTEKKVYALIDPLHFYMFVFDLEFPMVRGTI